MSKENLNNNRKGVRLTSEEVKAALNAPTNKNITFAQDLTEEKRFNKKKPPSTLRDNRQNLASQKNPESILKAPSTFSAAEGSKIKLKERRQLPEGGQTKADALNTAQFYASAAERDAEEIQKMPYL